MENSYNLYSENIVVKFVVHDVTSQAYKQVKLNGNNIISTWLAHLRLGNTSLFYFTALYSGTVYKKDEYK